MKKYVFKKNNNLKKVLTVIAVILLGAILIGVCVNLNKLQTTERVGLTDWSICAINTTTGANVDSHKAISMNNKETVDGMEIKVGDNAQITYKIVFYDEDKDFVSITNALATDFDTANIPATAEFFRVTIIPNQVDGEDVTITIFNISAYVGQITITFDK